MRKTLAALGSAAALVLTPATASVQPAAAAPAAGWDRCPNGSFCVFDGVEGTGTIAWFSSGSPDLRGQSMDNRTSSYWNRTAYMWGMYDGYHYSGSCFPLVGGAKASLPSRFPQWDNRASSVTRNGCG